MTISVGGGLGFGLEFELIQGLGGLGPLRKAWLLEFLSRILSRWSIRLSILVV